MPSSYPPRPPRWQERLGHRLLLALAPRTAAARPVEPPPGLGAPEPVRLPVNGGDGGFSGRWYPAPEPARGVVLLLHPWVAWAQAYFLRGGRLEALGRAGYHALTVDLPGFGGSAPAAGLPDREMEDLLAAARRRAGELPLHVWGVSAGAYWMHLVLSRRDGVEGAVFEQVSPHLLEYSSRTAPRWRFMYRTFRRLVPAAYRFLDLRRHAPHLGARRVTYVGGGRDEAVPEADTRELARLAGAGCLVIPEAVHLGAIRVAPEAVIAAALATFGGS